MWFENFITNRNNISVPKSEYLYGTRHIIVLILTVVLTFITFIVFKNKEEKIKRRIFKVMGFFFLFWEVSTRIVNLIIIKNLTTNKILEILLPMHICSVMVWVLIFAIFLNNKTLINFGAIFGILATVAYLLYPATGLHQVYINFTNIYSITSHMIGFVCSVSFITLKQTKFDMKEIWKVYLCAVLMFVWGAIINFIILPGSDYMYMVNDPLELKINFPYQILYSILIILYVFVFYLITFIKKKKCKKK